MNNVTALIGDEYDDALVIALNQALMDNNIYIVKQTSTLDIQIIEVEINNKILLIEKETFVGLTITGDKLVVDEFVRNIYNKLHIDKSIKYLTDSTSSELP
jgi:transcription elongation factor